MKPNTYLIAAYVVTALLAYAFLHNNHRPDDLDDAWTLSFVHNYVHHGIQTDTVFGDEGNGVQFYGKIHALLVGSFLDAAGWTRANAHLTSFLFLLAALGTWTVLLRRMGGNREIALHFFLAGLLLEPFFTAGTSARPDALAFLLSTLAASLFAGNRFGASALAACLAFEVHPMGIMAIFYAAAVLLASEPHRRALLREGGWIRWMVGLALGGLVYVSLHAPALAQLPDALLRKNVSSSGPALGCLYDYFFRTKYYRHLPELALFLACLYLFWKGRLHREDRFTTALLAVLAVAALLIRRPNFHYTVHFYPVLLLVALRVFGHYGRSAFLLWGFLLFLVPQYLFVHVRHRDFDFEGEVRAVRTMVPDDGLPVVGGPNAWFSFRDRRFHSHDYVGDPSATGLERFYLLVDDRYRSRQDGRPMKEWIEGNFTGKGIQRRTIGPRSFESILMEPKPGGPRP